MFLTIYRSFLSIISVDKNVHIYIFDCLCQYTIVAAIHGTTFLHLGEIVTSLSRGERTDLGVAFEQVAELHLGNSNNQSPHYSRKILKDVIMFTLPVFSLLVSWKER